MMSPNNFDNLNNNFDGRNGSSKNDQPPAPMSVMGDMRDAPVVIVMFAIGVAAWFLEESCVC